MTSPVGHCLGGWLVSKPSTLNWRWLLFIFFAANAADLDFFVGALQGQVNRYHHMASHSLFAAVVFTTLTYLIAKRLKLDAAYAAMVGGLAYSSHLFLDAFTIDSSAPIGMQLIWPLSQEYFIAPYTFFTNIHHGSKGDTLWEALAPIFSAHNAGAIALELIVLTPVLILVKLIRKS